MNDNPSPPENSRLKTVFRWLLQVIRTYLLPVLWTLIKYTALALWWLLRQGARTTRVYLIQPLARWLKSLPRSAKIVAALLMLIAVGVLTQIQTVIPSISYFHKDTVTPVPKESVVDSLLHDDRQAQLDTTRLLVEQFGLEAALDETQSPDTPFFVLPAEIYALANDAALKETSGRLTLTELAMMLRDLGFPFQPEEDEAFALQSALRQAVLHAIDSPNDEGSDALLFLQAMALKQKPGIDLTEEGWHPQLYRLTYLELFAFLSLFLAPQTEALQTGASQTSFGAKLTGWLTETAYADEAPTPAPTTKPTTCSIARQWLGSGTSAKDGGPNGYGISDTGLDLIKMLNNELAGRVTEALNSAAAKAMTAVSAAFKLLKLGMLYSSIEVEVAGDPASLHKQNSSENEKEVNWTAKVGVNEAKYKAYLEQWNATPLGKEVKECLSFYGIPVPTDTADIAKEIDKWSVEWDLVAGGGKHAVISLNKNEFELPGQFQSKVQRISDIAGEASLVTDVVDENVREHEGEEESAEVVVRALAETSAPPALIGSLFGSGKLGLEAAKSGGFELLGLADTLMDIAAGWFQEIVEPEAYGTTVVTYHVPEFRTYSYTGWVSASLRERDSWSNQHVEIVSRSASGQWQLDQSSTGDLSSSPLSLRGSGSVQMTSLYQRKSSGIQPCIGGTVQHTTTGMGWGSDRVTDDISARLTRSGTTSEGYAFNLYVGVSDSQGEPFEATIRHEEIPSGCKYVRHYESIKTRDIQLTAKFRSPTFQFESKEAYPEVITGSLTVSDEEDRTVIWRYELHRQEPVEGAKAYFDSETGDFGG
ncbi:hypothetical protein ACX1C1_02570 [Paenibacillus sp. strain BS8-2]